MAMNHNEDPITVIIGISLLIALGLLPFYFKSFMTWMYIAICCFIVVGLLGLVLHLRHNQKIKQENSAALAENPKRIAFTLLYTSAILLERHFESWSICRI
nr:hypothetical protein [Prevotella sp.]